MSYSLWKYFIEDDVDNFRQYLAKATFDRNASKAASAGHTFTLRVGSPGNLATSPKVSAKSRKSVSAKIVLTRSDVNARDGFGRTLLHHAVSSSSENAFEFVKTLLEIPFLDLYVQDTESGWTALHRALYVGNIAAAQALMLKDIQNATDYTTNVSHVNAGGLVKIKDHEGNSPFEVFGLTTAPRDLRQNNEALDALEAASVQSVDMDDRELSKLRDLRPTVDICGDEVFAFGSNKNITLGLGDGDDRTYPERIQLKRPEYLLQRLLEDFQQHRENGFLYDDLLSNLDELQDLPAIVRNKPIVVQDVAMSKLHTAILTQDPISNLYLCGFGPGGRLGTGDETTRFSFVCIQEGGLAKRRVASVALGQDHTVAVCSSGEVFTWGGNKYGQLGYELPEVSAQEVPLQLTPRQIYGLIKKEQIIGAAASSLHSVIYTSAGLYTFGKNEGQLGLMDADARSLETQIIPRRIGVSIIQHTVESVAVIDRATAVLLGNHDVIVFTHYGWTKVSFNFDSFGSTIASDAFFTRHKRQTKHISKITTGGNTICAMTTYGEVFTIDVPRHAESALSKSTTNPSKARNALSPPSKVWSIRKSHMAATDVAVGQDGSVVLCTAAGTVWKKEKRANIKSVHDGNTKVKDYKFVRVPNTFGAIAVRSNSFGAFTAIRKDCNVMKEQIIVEAPTIWQDVFELLAFRDYGEIQEDENTEEPQLRFWKPATKGPCPASIKRLLLTNESAEEDFKHLSKRFEPLSESDYDVWVTSTVCDVRLPAHNVILKSRSRILRRALAQFSESYYVSIPDVLAIEYGSDGQIQLTLQGADFLTVVNFVLYLYTDTLADVWRFTSKALHLAPRYRSIRTELMKIATAFDMRQLERAVRVMDEPIKCMRDDFDLAFHDSDLFSDADVVVDLADNHERYAHSAMLQARCPFFQGLFQGHTGGMWMADRRQMGDDGHEAVRIDLKHVNVEIFELVLRHIYADTAEGLFDAIVTPDLDAFIDIVIEVMAVANEMMLDRLARICQQIIGRFVTPWNVCGLLNTIAESSETEFKQAGLEYIGLNLEHLLELRLLEELDEYLVSELNESVQSNQLAFMPIGRSDRGLQALVEQDPTLIEGIEQGRQRRVDSMRLPSRYVFESVRPTLAKWSGSKQRDQESATRKPSTGTTSPRSSPGIAPLDDLPFEMDEDNVRPKPRLSPSASPSINAMPDRAQGLTPPRIGHSQHFTEDSETDLPSMGTTPQFAGLTSVSTFLSTSQGTSSRAVWAKPSTSTSGLGLKDIMLLDSSPKISDLTQSLKQAASSSKQPATKLSQKERKRQQVEQKRQGQTQATRMEEKTKDAEKAGDPPSSPWQKVAQKPSPSPVPPVPQAATDSPSTTRPPLAANNAKSARSAMNEKDDQPSRSASTPGMTGFSNAPPPQIQSIRHTPIPARSSSWVDARSPMAEILAQQQFEKRSIKETAAKRSLQEIQQEQEFQQWWELESQRLQEEEAATRAAIRKAQGGRNGRRKASGNSGRKDGQQADTTKSVQTDSAALEHAQSSQRGRPKARGGFRGRGRGLEAVGSNQVD